MLQDIYEMRVQFQIIRAAALKVNQPMLVYLAEMGIEECNEQMARLRNKPSR